LGGSSLAAQQTGLQVTGNNIANAGTEGYTRQTVKLTPGGPLALGNGQYVGTGVEVDSIERQANEAINESLRDATSNQTGAQTLDTLLGQVQTTFGALNDNDLATQMTSFFNSFSTLANNPGDSGQQAVVVQNGASLANYLQSLRGQLSSIANTTQAQVGTLVSQANSLASSIANLNQQICTSGNGSGTDNSLLDQRDQDLTQLSQIMNIRTIDQGNGMVNVLVGSMPLVQGTISKGVSSVQATDATGKFTSTQITFAASGDTMNVTGGQLGTLVSAQGSYVNPAIQSVDTLASGLISAVNAIHTQGQGTAGFSSVTGTTEVTNPDAALNAGPAANGMAFTPTNGTFDLYLTNAATGQTTTQQIDVNLSGQGAQTTLNGLAASITAAGGGTVTATANADGTLAIASHDGNVTFGFGEDTSGVLAALGINTFFTGSDATNIGVNGVLANDPAMLATGRGNIPGSNTNAQALSLAGSAAASQLGGKSLTDYYANYITSLATQAKSASDNNTAQTTIQQSLQAQQQAISGVSMDEEAINLTKYQRAYEGSAQFINVVNQLMQTLLTMIGTV